MTTLLEIKNLVKYFPIGHPLFFRTSDNIHAVNGVNLKINSKDTLGLVGESGCGKTTVAKLILRLIEPTSGNIYFKDRDVFKVKKKDILDLRKQIQMIFQDPFASLNPRMNVLQIVGEPFRVHKLYKKEEVNDRVKELLQIVGLSPPELYIERYPHQFSGGQRQRIALARAIAVEPSFIVLDEPVSSLDISIRGQILNLLINLQKEKGLTYLFITHDLSVVRSFCNKVAVMYLGKIVELAEVEDVFNNSLHPYTKILLSSTPIPDPKITRGREKSLITGEVPSLIDLPVGCYFYNRCPVNDKKCMQKQPELGEHSQNHFVSCHLYS
jgi:peptide/nickel transport system ATP-binding protein